MKIAHKLIIKKTATNCIFTAAAGYIGPALASSRTHQNDEPEPDKVPVPLCFLIPSRPVSDTASGAAFVKPNFVSRRSPHPTGWDKVSLYYGPFFNFG